MASAAWIERQWNTRYTWPRQSPGARKDGAARRVNGIGPLFAGRVLALSTQTEMAQLRVRIVAIENLVIALLAQAPERQLLLAREMAVHISPRPGFTRHRLTLHAAGEMLSLVDRARRFQSAPPP